MGNNAVNIHQSIVLRDGKEKINEDKI